MLSKCHIFSKTMRRILIDLFFIINFTKCIERQTPKVKNLLPNFRRQVEEIPEEFTTAKSEDDANINLVAFLVKNAKEIFGETEEITDTAIKSSKIPEKITFPEETTLLEERRTLPAERTFPEEIPLLEERTILKERTFPKEKTFQKEKTFTEKRTLPEEETFTEEITFTEGGTFTDVGTFTEGLPFNEKETFPEFTTFSVPISHITLPSEEIFDIYSLRNVTASTITDGNAILSPSTIYHFGTIASTPATTIATNILFSTTSSTTSYFENTTIPSRLYKLPTRTTGIDYTVNVESIKSDLLNITNVHIIEKGKKDAITLTRKQDRLHDDISIYNIPVAAKEMSPLRRFCIVCNNIQMQECNEPKNKMVPTAHCENEEDLCYTQQTPFGLIDRGCFNVNHNVTTYVCSCNLCNYISISDMPYTFSKRKDWLDNVIDLSRTRNLRTSIYKNMSCLSCEVNSTTRSTDLLDHVNCQEGNTGVLPNIQCADDEICGVKAVKNKGYVWRGCLKSPLYNYWWSLCDSDLCNTENIVSLYDEV